MGYEVIWEPKGVVKRLFGHVSNNDLMRSSTIIQGDARFDELNFVIIDFSACVSHSVTDQALLEIAAIDEAASESIRVGRRIRIAIVCADAKILELAKQYANYKFDVATFGIFSDNEHARTWLHHKPGYTAA
jgi:hypothetical protein